MTDNTPTDHAPTAQPCSTELLDKLREGLSFISLTAGRIEGADEDDYLAADAIQREVDRIRVMLLEEAATTVEVPAMSAEAADRRLVA
jgi:hypothetical protein